MTTFNTRPVTASDVRSALREPAAFAALSEAAQRTVKSGARGRLHPDAIKAFNEGRKPSERYNETAPRTVRVTYKHRTKSGSRNKVVFVPEPEARELAGDKAGKRGPLSKAAIAAVGEALANR